MDNDRKALKYSDDSPYRMEKSLGLLTTKFVSLLQNSKDGVLDLNTVVSRFPQSIIKSGVCVYCQPFLTPPLSLKLTLTLNLTPDYRV